MWFIGVEIEHETSAPPPKKNPGSAPETASHQRSNPAFKAPKPQEMLQEIGQPRDLYVKPA